MKTAPFAPIPEHFTRMTELDEAWREKSSGVRLERVRAGARKVRERLLTSGSAHCVRTYFNATIPYPTKFAFAGAARSPAPYVLMSNRCNLVQVKAGGRVYTTLFNPTDHELSAETPFFARLRKKYGEWLAKTFIAKLGGQPLDHVRAAGLRPEDIDYVAFDHLHTQDVRKLLGGGGQPAQLPNAKLLVTPGELATFERLHPLQADWYIAAGVDGVPQSKIVLLDGDYLVGPGAALVRTPGHTEGNMSLAVHTRSGIWAISENGVGCDAYAPMASKIPGVRKWARARGVEVVMNSNTLEHTQDQYISMLLERELVDRAADAPDFYQHLSSSEHVGSPLAPGLEPTYHHGGLVHGVLETTQPRPAEAARPQARA